MRARFSVSCYFSGNERRDAEAGQILLCMRVGRRRAKRCCCLDIASLGSGRWSRGGSTLVSYISPTHLTKTELNFAPGLAIRMALDLGLNRNSDKWQYRGAPLFGASEKQMRKQIWFGCVMADEYSAVYMGRPVYIHESEFDIPLPALDAQEETEDWQPARCDPMQMVCDPVPARVMSCFRASATLCACPVHCYFRAKTEADTRNSGHCDGDRVADLPRQVPRAPRAAAGARRDREPPGQVLRRAAGHAALRHHHEARRPAAAHTLHAHEVLGRRAPPAPRIVSPGGFLWVYVC